MPGGFPEGLDICNPVEYNPTPTGNGFATAVAPSATANTKGAFTQLVAATSADACWCSILVFFAATTGTETAVDIAVGASGSEVVVFNNLRCSGAGSQNAVATFSFPCAIPKGTRISARSQVNAASGTSPGVAVTLFDGGFTQMEGAAGVDAIGFNSATSQGVALTGGSGKGSYGQLTAATARDYIGLFAYVGWNAGTNLSYYTTTDVAIGAGGSEIVIVPDITASYQSGAGISPFLPIAIPAGARIAGRMQSVFGSGYQNDLTVYGVYR
ncbi:MAG: hypothetical protein ABFD89_18395 [Bryobacteraceae bacterium]